MSERVITVAEFEDRLAALCLDGPGSAFPRRDRDRQILYRSIVQSLEVRKNYSEPMMNAALQQWLSSIGTNMNIDHVTLRRYLVDEAYLVRDLKGSVYSVNLPGRGRIEFEQAVADIDSMTVIQDAKARVAARKRERAMRAKP